ncbi:glutathione S-transferase-like protein [Dentipellis sp. KUC8613]|nr:glutathione S-transferase-like protein [Dentipellis sp. KUC8613]
MVLKIYGVSWSTCTRRVALIAREKNVPYELVELDLAKGDNKTPAYLAKQPFAETPYIDDGGFVLFESRAIGRYIATKWAAQGTSLIPTDLEKLALFEQAASIELTSFDGYAVRYAVEKIFNPQKGIATNEERAAEYLKMIETKLDVYDQILGKQKYLAGDELSLADLFHLPGGYILVKLGKDVFSPRPNVSRWWDEISSRSSWQAVKESA